MNLPRINPKTICIYNDKDIEFTIEILNERKTCGWLLSEVTKRYTNALNKLKDSSPSHKRMRKFIVFLKTADVNESIDYWLTQYER